MLQKLRRKFILIIMALVTATLVIMVGVIVGMNYQQLTSDVYQTLEYATTESAFSVPESLGISIGMGFGEDRAETIVSQEDTSAGNGTDSGDSSGNNNRESADGQDSDSFSFIERVSGADMMAASIYLVASDGTTQTVMNALELDRSVATSALLSVLGDWDFTKPYDECAIGHLDDEDLYYGVRNTGRNAKVAFISGSYVSESISDLAAGLIAVSAVVWAIFLVISVFLARWVVRPAERAWNQQSQFVADASHELKTPLAVMMANNSILLSNPDKTIESQQRWVESNQAEARQMLALVNDMLFLARPENVERKLVRETVDFSAIVERNALQFEAVCFEREIQLEDDVTPGLHMLGDANRLQRLASTLIDNACKYADHHVSVKLSKVGKQLHYVVTNDGAVIPAEDLPHVFDRFYRVDKARVRSEGGVGLGLAIAQEVAHEHGGTITVKSDAESGTVFTATIPCAQE